MVARPPNPARFPSPTRASSPVPDRALPTRPPPIIRAPTDTEHDPPAPGPASRPRLRRHSRIRPDPLARRRSHPPTHRAARFSTRRSGRPDPAQPACSAAPHRMSTRAVFSLMPAIRAMSRTDSPRSFIARSATPHSRSWPARRSSACTFSAATRSANQSSTASARWRAEKNTVRSSMLARVRAATACCAAIVASRAACRAAFVVALLAIAHTLSPPKPLMPHPNSTTFPTSTAPAPSPPHRCRTNQPALSRPVEDCEGCPALAGVRNLGLDDPSAGRPDSHCNFGDRSIRACRAAASTQRKSLKRAVPAALLGTHLTAARFVNSSVLAGSGSRRRGPGPPGRWSPIAFLRRLSRAAFGVDQRGASSP